MTVGLDFDFAKYIQNRRGLVEQRARDGAAYSFAGERKVRRALITARPVSMAIEATTRLWKKVAKNELLGTSIRVTDQQFPRLHVAARRAAKALRIDPPEIYVAPASSKIKAQALGTNDDSYIVVNSQLLENLSDDELASIVGHECGHIQNNHVVYATALYYLNNAAMMFVRWIVQPAIMALQAWSRRAEITCDRAALLTTGSLEITLGAMVKTALGLEGKSTVNVAEYLENLPNTSKGIGKLAELFRSDPYLPKRVQALRLFSESAFYRLYKGDKPGADEEVMSSEQLDVAVGQIVSVF